MSVEMETREILDSQNNVIGALSLPVGTPERDWATALAAYRTSLAACKDAKVSAIDRRTQELIRRGFTFDDEQFSLSLNAQLNWLGIKSLSEVLSFPIEVTTIDDGVYNLAQDDVLPFVATAAATVQAYLESGRALKQLALAAEDHDALDEVVDPR